jgi:ferredoxin
MLTVQRLNVCVVMCFMCILSHGLQFPWRRKHCTNFSRSLRLCSSNDGEKDSPTTTTKSRESTTPSYTVHVSYENQCTTMFVNEHETLLAALERNQISDRLSLPNHMIPSDCRRGNCLTCSGTHASSSSRESQSVVTDDGLSPYLSRWMQEKGYILTCSSIVVNDGLELKLGEYTNAWKEIYQTRLGNDQLRVLGWSAMARTKRKSDEKNLPRWTKVTEGVLNDGKNASGR